MTAHARDIAAGTRLGTYEVLRKLATGGMAEIYLARMRGQFEFEKLVVLKTILPSVADDPTYVAMFLDEARLAATLHHPNIAQVHDVGSDGGVCFFAMEFVHGEDARTLRQAARKSGTPLPLAHALAVIHATASALHYAHDKSIVHRDVSPSNILISYDGAVKLVDFGIARAQARETKTRTGTLKGKIPYMSPEQCRGLPTDRRSDLFSLGVCLQELTCGRRPFHGNGNGDFAILEQIVHGVPTRPSELIADFPPALEHIIGQLIARDPDHRYPTGEELLIDLEAFIADANLRVSPITLGRYMQGLFAEKIAAWQQADSEGVSLAQHVARTITSESQRSEQMLTPASSVSGMRPAGAWSRSASTTPAPVAAKVAKTADAVARKRSATMPPLVTRPASATKPPPIAAKPTTVPPPPPPPRATGPKKVTAPPSDAEAETSVVTAAVAPTSATGLVPPQVAAAATALAQTRAPGPRSAPRAVAVLDDELPSRVSLLGAPSVTAPVAPRRRGLAFVIAALAIGGAGVGIGMYLAPNDDAPVSTAPAPSMGLPPAPAPPSIPTATPIATPIVEPGSGSAAAAPAPPADPVPPPVPAPVPPPVPAPVPDPDGDRADTPTEPEPAPAPAEAITPVVIKQPPARPAKPARPGKKPKKPPPKPADEPEEDETWDRDSPFLPH